MTTFLRVSAFFAALLILVYGFSDTDQQVDKIWLVLLGVAGILMAFAWWPRNTRSLPVFNRTLLRWMTIILVGFALVSVQLVRVQVVESSRIASRTAETPDGEVVMNPRNRLKALEVRRGRIVDRDGQVLADTVRTDEGTWERTWPEPSTGPLIGYYSPLLYGAANIEDAYDEYLMGDEGGNPFKELLDDVLHAEQRGYDLTLSIDLELQQLSQQLLGDRQGAVVLMDANTGEILAMYGAPIYDPNRLYANAGQQTPEELAAVSAYWAELNANDAQTPLVFRPTGGLFNPGSTFKTVTASAIINEGIADGGTIYRDEGIFEVDGRVIEELNRPDPNQVNWTLKDAYAYSLNVVFAQLGLQLGSDLLLQYGSRFGFEESIPFDFDTAESQIVSERGLLNNRSLLADTGFGQGEILATPLQMALVAAAIVNEGTLMEPFVVTAARDSDGQVVERWGKRVWRRPISPDTAKIVRDLMIASADYGYARDAAIEGVTVGGKTGTAELGEGQVPHSWFIGFADTDERDLAVSVIVEHGGPGSQAALPIGSAMLQAALQNGDPE